MLRDVILVVRADEAHHRDVNHAFANERAGLAVVEHPVSPYPEHAADIRLPAPGVAVRQRSGAPSRA